MKMRFSIYFIAAAACIVWFSATLGVPNDAPDQEAIGEYIQNQSGDLKSAAAATAKANTVSSSSSSSSSPSSSGSANHGENAMKQKQEQEQQNAARAHSAKMSSGSGSAAAADNMNNNHPDVKEHVTIPLSGDKKNQDEDQYTEFHAMLNSWSFYLYEKLGDRNLICLGLCLHTTLYFLVGFIYHLFEVFRLFPQYRIQPGLWATGAEFKFMLGHLTKVFFFGLLPATYFGGPYLSAIGITANRPLPHLKDFCWEIFVCWLLEDILQYFAHRFLHWGIFYKYVHKQHHEFTAPFALAASYCHPIEIIGLGFCTFAGPILVRPHLFVMVCWMIIQQTDACHRHSGYNFPWDIVNYIPMYGGPAFHDAHHETFNYNYASRFIIIDWLLNTYRDPVKLVEQHRKRQEKIEKDAKSANKIKSK